VKFIEDGQSQKIMIPNQELAHLKDDEGFILILQLMRFTNQMTTAWSITKMLADNPESSQDRNRKVSFLYSCALLYEFFTSKGLYPQINQYFSGYKSFKTGLMKINCNKKRIQYHEKYFKKARNKILFHFDKDLVAEKLKTFVNETHSIELMYSSSGTKGDMYFPFVDEILFNSIFEIDQVEGNEEQIREVMSYVADLSNDVIDSSEKLIFEYFSQFMLDSPTPQTAPPPPA